MKPYHTNIRDEAAKNDYFRRVLFTSDSAQLVVMSLKPGEDIGLETHDLDQYLFFEQGNGTMVLDGQESSFSAGDVVVVPKGTEHNFTNTSDGDMKLFTVYAPPEHPDGTIHETKAEAEAHEHH